MEPLDVDSLRLKPLKKQRDFHRSPVGLLSQFGASFRKAKFCPSPVGVWAQFESNLEPLEAEFKLMPHQLQLNCNAEASVFEAVAFVAGGAAQHFRRPPAGALGQ